MSASPRLAALSGAVGIALFDVAWFWDPAAPYESDRRVAAWYASHGDGAWLTAGLLTMLAAPFLLVFARAVRDRLAAGGASAREQGLASGAAKGFAIAVLVFGAVYAGIPAARTFTDVGAPSGAVSRFAGSAEFAVWMLLSSALIAAFAVGLAAAAFRSRALPRWLGAVVLVLVVPSLANPLFPMAGITLLVLVVSIALAAGRPADRPAAPEPTPVPASL